MNALAWLRSRRTTPAPSALAVTHDTAAQPTGFIQVETTLTDEEADALRERFLERVNAAQPTGDTTTPPTTQPTPALAADAGTITVEPERQWHGPCPVCSIRYSRCYCGGNQ